MFSYAIATLPLINELEDHPNITQLWYADDSTALGSIISLLTWFENLLNVGPRYGYSPEPSKSFLIVSESLVNEATNLFNNYGVNVVTGHRFLGGFIGDERGTTSYVKSKVQEWSHHIELLSTIAKTQPQAAFITLTKSLQHEWTFIQRVIRDNGSSLPFQALEDLLGSTFIPSLLGHDCSDLDRTLFSLPIKMGGLNIRIPTITAITTFDSSRAATRILVDSITCHSEFSLMDHIMTVSEARHQFNQIKYITDEQIWSSVFNQADPTHQRSLQRHRYSLTNWLNTLPIQKDHFDLSATEFRDTLCIRYLKPLLNIHPHCDGCGEPFSTSHALDCRKGGLIVQRHNEIRDVIIELSSQIWSQTIKEPVIDDSPDSDRNLKADIGIRGVWQSQAMSLYDVRVLDSDAPSY